MANCGDCSSSGTAPRGFEPERGEPRGALDVATPGAWRSPSAHRFGVAVALRVGSSHVRVVTEPPITAPLLIAGQAVRDNLPFPIADHRVASPGQTPHLESTGGADSDPPEAEPATLLGASVGLQAGGGALIRAQEFVRVPCARDVVSEGYASGQVTFDDEHRVVPYAHPATIALLERLKKEAASKAMMQGFKDCWREGVRCIFVATGVSFSLSSRSAIAGGYFLGGAVGGLIVNKLDAGVFQNTFTVTLSVTATATGRCVGI